MITIRPENYLAPTGIAEKSLFGSTLVKFKGPNKDENIF